MTTDTDGREANASDQRTVGIVPGIRLECPSCKGVITVTSENIAGFLPLVGHKATCPSCGETSLVGIAGLGGWLILPAIGRVLTPLWSAYYLIIAAASDRLGSPPESFLSLAIGFVFIAFQIYVSVMFFMKKPYAPVLVITSLLANLALALLAAAVGGSGGWAAGAVVTAAVWVPYFLVSKRVKATFGRKGVIRPVSRTKSRKI